MGYDNLLVEVAEGGVGVVTLNRPERLNALSHDLMRELDEVLTGFEHDEDVRCVVLTGAGERAFSSGADIHEAIERGEERGFGPYQWHFATLRKPTIGALNGLAFGGGALLATELDIRIGCDRTQFRFVQAAAGRIGVTWTLPLIVGWARAKELLLTARVVEAEEAYQMGLLNKLVAPDEVLPAAIDLARQIAKHKPAVIQGLKQLLGEQVGRSWEDMLASERAFRDTVPPPPPPTEAFREFLARKRRGFT